MRSVGAHGHAPLRSAPFDRLRVSGSGRFPNRPLRPFRRPEGARLIVLEEGRRRGGVAVAADALEGVEAAAIREEAGAVLVRRGQPLQLSHPAGQVQDGVQALVAQPQQSDGHLAQRLVAVALPAPATVVRMRPYYPPAARPSQLPPRLLSWQRHIG